MITPTLTNDLASWQASGNSASIGGGSSGRSGQDQDPLQPRVRVMRVSLTKLSPAERLGEELAEGITSSPRVTEELTLASSEGVRTSNDVELDEEEMDSEAPGLKDNRKRKGQSEPLAKRSKLVDDSMLKKKPRSITAVPQVEEVITVEDLDKQMPGDISVRPRRRAASNICLKEPSLNKKMRQGDPGSFGAGSIAKSRSKKK